MIKRLFKTKENTLKWLSGQSKTPTFVFRLNFTPCTELPINFKFICGQRVSGTSFHCLVYVDKGANRWIMTIGESSCDCSTTMYSIYMYFPRSNTQKATCCSMRTTPIEHLIDSSYLKDHGRGIVISDISNWTAK